MAPMKPNKVRKLDPTAFKRGLDFSKAFLHDLDNGKIKVMVPCDDARICIIVHSTRVQRLSYITSKLVLE